MFEIENVEQFRNEIESSEKIVIVDFFATWCGPCKMLMSVLEAVSKTLENEIKIIKVDIDNFNALSNEFEVRSVPTLIFFKNGQQVLRSSGYVDENTLINMVKSIQNK